MLGFSSLREWSSQANLLYRNHITICKTLIMTRDGFMHRFQVVDVFWLNYHAIYGLVVFTVILIRVLFHFWRFYLINVYIDKLSVHFFSIYMLTRNQEHKSRTLSLTVDIIVHKDINWSTLSLNLFSLIST